MAFYVYILSSRSRVLYVGVTNALLRRLREHRAAEGGEFTNRYRVDRLIYCEAYDRIIDAIGREKQIKSWTRAKKEALIAAANPEWEELFFPHPDPSLRSG